MGKEFIEFKCDESYFGAKRIAESAGAAGKPPVFGLLKSCERVYVKVIESYSSENLMPIIQWTYAVWLYDMHRHWKAYDGLLLNGYEHHYENEFACGKGHVTA